MHLRHVLAMIAVATAPATSLAQPSYLNLTIDDVGIAIGDAPRVTGLRINFRDRYLDRVNGVNLTVWTPYEATGEVKGIAIGGLSIAGLGVGAGGVSQALLSPASGSAAGGRSAGCRSPAWASERRVCQES